MTKGIELLQDFLINLLMNVLKGCVRKVVRNNMLMEQLLFLPVLVELKMVFERSALRPLRDIFMK